MDIRKEYQAKIDSLSTEIAESIAKIPGLTTRSMGVFGESQESMAYHLEMLMMTRNVARKNLDRYEQARARAIANLS